MSNALKYTNVEYASAKIAGFKMRENNQPKYEINYFAMDFHHD